MNPGNIYFFNVNNSNTRKKYDICPKLKIKTPKRRHSGVFIVNFVTLIPSISIVHFEQVNDSWNYL